MATESSIDVIHYPDVFLVGLTGGDEAGDHRSLFAGNTTAVEFPDDLVDNTTVLAFLGYQIPSTSISFGSPDMKTFTLFAASDNSIIHMQGRLWKLASQSMTETIIPAGGGKPQVKVVFPAGTSGAQSHSVSLKIGDYACYEKK